MYVCAGISATFVLNKKGKQRSKKEKEREREKGGGGGRIRLVGDSDKTDKLFTKVTHTVTTLTKNNTDKHYFNKVTHRQAQS